MTDDTKPTTTTKTKAPMDVVWDWLYEVRDDRIDSLYKKAKRDQWNADVEIDWARSVDPGGKILDEDRMGILKLGFFKKLSKSQLEAFNAHQSAHILSQILHGEQGALMVACALGIQVPDYDGKLYVASQAMDEARHVEVFQRYIRKLDKIYPVTEPLAGLLDMIMSAPQWHCKSVGMQVILEGLAVGTFINVRAATSCDLLREVLTYVTKDEARHVAFGNTYLTERIADLHPDEKAEVEDFTLNMTKRFMEMRRGPDGMKGFDRVLIDTGIDPEDFLKALMEERAAGFKLKNAPGSVHSFRGIIMPGIVRAGLVSDRTRPEYEAANIKVFSDTEVLDQIERNDGFFASA